MDPPEQPRAADAARPLLIFPCNGNGIEALHCLGHGHRMLGFVDDTPAKRAAPAHGHAVMSRAAFAEWPDAMVLAVPGSAQSYRSRAALIRGLNIDGDRWAQVIHPAACISPLARIGCNVLIMAGVVITSNAVIGDHVCVLPNTVIHHDARIGDWSLVGANVTVAGNTLVGENCYIGSGSSLMNGLEIGDGTLVGLGSVVIRSTAPGSRIAGCPARPR
jgi:sugar O-acyltransferase (sialic acid O-acetyltransferase NeuD family)